MIQNHQQPIDIDVKEPLRIVWFERRDVGLLLELKEGTFELSRFERPRQLSINRSIDL